MLFVRSRWLKSFVGCGALAALASMMAWWGLHQANARPQSDRVEVPTAEIDAPTGLAVHLNFRDVESLIQLSDGGRLLVHGITPDAQLVQKARAAVATADLTGVVSVERGTLTQLPYVDHLANVVVVDDFTSLAEGGLSLDEVMRVVAPEGAAWIGVADRPQARAAIDAAASALGVDNVDWQQRDRLWARLVKPRPEAMGVWSHRRHNAQATAVSDETMLDVPTGLRWIAGPSWATHLRYSAVQGVTASNRRLVYFYDDEISTPEGRKRQYAVVARDGFNGLLLWKRWLDHTPRPSLLLTRDDHVYTQLEIEAPLVALNTNTGETAIVYDEITDPTEILLEDGRLVAATRQRLVCVDPATGKPHWSYDVSASDLRAGDGRLFFLTSGRRAGGERTKDLVCLDLATGAEHYVANTAEWAKGSSLGLRFYADGYLVFSGSGGNYCASAADGSYLWNYQYERIGHGGSYAKTLYFDGLVWVHPATVDGRKQYAWEGLDPQTGEVAKRFRQPEDFRLTHRCYEDRASGRQILCGTMNFVDRQTGEYDHFAAARHSCRDGGVLPANGQLYTFPHSCHCYPMLRGFLGLATKPSASAEQPELEPGPALATVVTRPLPGDLTTDWHTVRGNAERTGSTSAQGPERLDILWSRALDIVPQGALVAEWPWKEAERLTSPVVARETVYVAAVDAHRLEAIDAHSGQPRWSFTADGRIDAPPTIYGGLCLFGARDGHVYCVQADDGALVWRLRVAPRDERVVAYGQLESTWPVVGGVLVHQGVAYVCAGRHSHGDGGIYVTAVRPSTGEVLWREQPGEFKGLADMLVARDQTVNLISWEFDAATGANRASETESDYLRAGRLGLVNRSWYDRPVALRKSGQNWSMAGEFGQMLVFNDTHLCGFRAGDDEQPSDFSKGTLELQGQARVFGKQIERRRNAHEWTLAFPAGSQVRAMAIAGDRLYFAGRLDGKNAASNAVQVVSLSDGELLRSQNLPAEPVHEGLAVTADHVVLSLQDGTVLCLGKP